MGKHNTIGKAKAKYWKIDVEVKVDKVTTKAKAKANAPTSKSKAKAPDGKPIHILISSVSIGPNVPKLCWIPLIQSVVNNLNSVALDHAGQYRTPLLPP